MRFVLTIADFLVEDPIARNLISSQIAALARESHEILVIHENCRTLASTLHRMNVESRFDVRQRIVDEESRNIAVLMFRKMLRQTLMAALLDEGQPALDISLSLPRCLKAEPVIYGEISGGLGYAGYLTGVNETFLRSLWQGGFIPITSSIGMGLNDEIYLINTDHMAAACAEFIHADHLFYLARTEGVFSWGHELNLLYWGEINSFLQDSLAHTCALTTLESVKRALYSGVRTVRLINGARAGTLLREVAMLCDEVS